MVVRHVGVWSVARIAAALYGGLGLIAGVIFALIATAGMGFAAAQGNQDVPAWFGAFFGVGAIVFLPICYAVIGLLIGAIMAGLYNLFAGMVGGAEIDFDRPSTAGV
ncbi:MAG TPA: hypothetical protein VFK20_14295 [Vicinamibacterales bacterium]|nr:hypothetical protein [Vicinamibacterales bacterium]